ncbi:hypothetical protein B0H11DRAFT_1905077 [Mycena galericulata]|nr:hypothetical protein B0H11DRAFT_1905077 [Mycena galericulata]
MALDSARRRRVRHVCVNTWVFFFLSFHTFSAACLQTVGSETEAGERFGVGVTPLLVWTRGARKMEVEGGGGAKGVGKSVNPPARLDTGARETEAGGDAPPPRSVITLAGIDKTVCPIFIYPTYVLTTSITGIPDLSTELDPHSRDYLIITSALSVKLAESLYLTPDNLGPISQDQYHNAERKACFAARFLPSLITAYKCSLESHSDAARACYSSALTCVMHSPYFVKYLRRKGDTTLLEFHADRFLERWPVPEGICDKPEDHREYPILFLMDSLDILHFLLHYAAQFPRYLTPLSQSKYKQAETWLKVASIVFHPESEASIIGSKLTAPAELLKYTPWLKCGCFNGDGHQHDGAVGCSAMMPKTRLKNVVDVKRRHTVA